MPFLTPDTDGSGQTYCRRLAIPNDIGFISAVSGALLTLTQNYSWEKFGTLTPDECADIMFAMYNDFVKSVGCMIGTVFPYATSTPPSGSLPCDGTTYLRADYSALYDVLDSAFIIDSEHFSTPDLRGRTLVGIGTGAGLSARAMGGNFGNERVTLDISQIPSHSHSEVGSIATIINGGLEAPASSAIPSVGVTGSVGGGLAHDNIQPSLALGYAIWAR